MRTLGDTAVGQVVWLKVDGSYAPFRVMHHGKPDDTYDDSYLGGTILCLDHSGGAETLQMVADAEAAKGTYAQSNCHQVLNSIWLARLDNAMEQLVMEVKLPYRTDTDGSPYEAAAGSDGLAAKVWLPSLSEVTDLAYHLTGYGDPYVAEGAMFDYWKDADTGKYGLWKCEDSTGGDAGWSVRTPSMVHGDADAAPFFYYIAGSGSGYPASENEMAVWPCLVLPDSLLLDGDDYLHPAGAVPVKVDGIWQQGTVSCKTGGAWNEAAAVAAKIGGVWKE